MNVWCTFTFLILLASHSFVSTADEDASPKEPILGEAVDKATEVVSSALGETRARRGKNNYFILGNYSPIDLIIPSKYGATIGYIQNADKTWEFEYLKGSVSVPFLVRDLGEMSDERFSLIRRSHMGTNSFNLSYGLTYFDFSIHLGDKLLSRVSGGTYPSIDLVEVQSLGANFAIGNRWTFKHNITFGVDWFSWAQPIFVINKKSAFLDYASNQDDKDDVDTALKWISYFPRFAFFKLQLGMLF